MVQQMVLQGCVLRKSMFGSEKLNQMLIGLQSDNAEKSYTCNLSQLRRGELRKKRHYSYYWEICRQKSRYYCLLSFFSIDANSNPAFEIRYLNNEVTVDSTYYKWQQMKFDACDECREIFRPVVEKHNLFIFWEGCCLGYNFNYFSYGFRDALLTPKEYLEKLTDYSEEGKTLNYILAYYLPDCETNVITKLGFGSGNLRRVDHRYINTPNQKPATPYQIKIGQEWSSKIPYDNPEDFLTFKWFKQNIMCLDQPWICREDEKQSAPPYVASTTFGLWEMIFGKT